MVGRVRMQFMVIEKLKDARLRNQTDSDSPKLSHSVRLEEVNNHLTTTP